MNKSEPSAAEITSQKATSALQPILAVALRILGIRKKELYDGSVEQLTPMQVGFACILALLAFTAIMAALAILAVKYMG